MFNIFNIYFDSIYIDISNYGKIEEKTKKNKFCL